MIKNQIKDFIYYNLPRLKLIAGEDTWCENNISSTNFLLLYDTTVPGYLIRVYNSRGEIFTAYKDGKIDIEDKVSAHFFFYNKEYKEIEKKITSLL